MENKKINDMSQYDKELNQSIRDSIRAIVRPEIIKILEEYGLINESSKPLDAKSPKEI